MKTLIRMDSTGDTAIEFDETTPEALAKAKVVFDDWMAKKRTAFLTKRLEGKEDLKITSFDQIEAGAETLLIPAIVAG